jgi:hypothetical protein
MIKSKMSETKRNVLIALVGIVALIALSFGGGYLQAFFNRTVGISLSSSQTDKFHASKGFTDGMTQDLSKYKLELARTTNEVERGAIVNHINEQFANFDEGTIKNADLRNFLVDCRSGLIK